MNVIDLQDTIFAGKVTEDADTGCWIWKRAINKDTGYGYHGFTGNLPGHGFVKRKHMTAHRLSYLLYNGEIADGLVVRHQCNVRSCVNPAHLLIGTYKDNSNDCIKSGNRSLRRKITKKYRSRSLKISQLLDWLPDNVIVSNTKCWEYNVVRGQVYPTIWFGNKVYRLHRLVVSLKENIDYEGDYVARHLCNNKKCVNPDHLCSGTLSDNAKDSLFLKENIKLTPEIIHQIRTDIHQYHGRKQDYDKLWADKLGISAKAVTHARIGFYWGVDDVIPKNGTKTNSKLNTETISQIRTAFKMRSGSPHQFNKAWAEKVGVCIETIRNIVLNKSYSVGE